MIKSEELANSNSCINRAEADEPTFVLLGRDIVAPYAVRRWADVRIRLGKNNENDPQIIEALECAEKMEAWQSRKGAGA